MSELDDALRALMRDGWAFTYPRDDNGDILLGMAARFYLGGWWDGLILTDEHECTALRVDPDDMITWVRYGSTLDMALAAAELPAPGERLAPDRAKGVRMSGLWWSSGAR